MSVSSISSEEDSSSIESTAIHFEFKIPCDQKMSKEDELSHREVGEGAPSVFEEPTQLMTLTDNVADEDKCYEKFGEDATTHLTSTGVAPHAEDYNIGRLQQSSQEQEGGSPPAEKAPSPKQQQKGQATSAPESK